MEMTMGAKCELTAGTGSPAGSKSGNPDYICPNCGQRMPMPESGGLHCTNCARYLPTPEQVQRVVNARQTGRLVTCHHCHRQVEPRSACSECGGRLL
jgi:DNA-directed RNA polymerase subunit RPC12/RpoP